MCLYGSIPCVQMSSETGDVGSIGLGFQALGATGSGCWELNFERTVLALYMFVPSCPALSIPDYKGLHGYLSDFFFTHI